MIHFWLASNGTIWLKKKRMFRETCTHSRSYTHTHLFMQCIVCKWVGTAMERAQIYANTNREIAREYNKWYQHIATYSPESIFLPFWFWNCSRGAKITGILGSHVEKSRRNNKMQKMSHTTKIGRKMEQRMENPTFRFWCSLANGSNDQRWSDHQNTYFEKPACMHG